MSDPVVQQLETLQKESGKSLPTSIIYGFSTSSGASIHLGDIVPLSATDWEVRPSGGKAGLLHNCRAYHKVFTLDHTKIHFMHDLNKELKGGANYPILTAVLGTAISVVGLASGVTEVSAAGLLFSTAVHGLDLAKRSTDVLARVGDEVWHVEEIGKVWEDNFFSADEYVPKYVSSFFLVDPYRSKTRLGVNGWLIHEQRFPVTLD